MTHAGFTKEERDALVGAYLEVRRRTSWPDSQNLSVEEGQELYQREDELLAEYSESLPSLPVSRCPFCASTLEYPIDPYGLDGPWWMSKPVVDFPEPISCVHFRVLLGAVDFHGRNPVEAEPWENVLPGPGVPFVVPGILEYTGTRAVLSQFQLSVGDTAYLVAYFIEQPNGGLIKYQPWPWENYLVLSDEGEYLGWGFSTDEWDFDLAPYIGDGLLQWIEPGDENLNVVSQGSCPFLDVPGVRQPQIIEWGEIYLGELPDGAPADPFD